jgi:predicted negative regulator of RcsB-dependent stress response
MIINFVQGIVYGNTKLMSWQYYQHSNNHHKSRISRKFNSALAMMPAFFIKKC